MNTHNPYTKQGREYVSMRYMVHNTQLHNRVLHKQQRAQMARSLPCSGYKNADGHYQMMVQLSPVPTISTVSMPIREALHSDQLGAGTFQSHMGCAVLRGGRAHGYIGSGACCSKTSTLSPEPRSQ